MKIVASGGDTYPFMALLQVAADRGWFEAAGLDVTIVPSEGGGDTVRILTAGSADIGIAGGTAVVLAAENPSFDIKVIGAWYQVNDFTWISARPGATLKGATLGFSAKGSSSELMVKAVQSKNPSDEVKSVDVGSLGDNWAAAKAGRITAGLSLPPYTNQLIAEENASILVDGRDVVGDLPADLVAVRSDYADKNPEAVKAFWEVADRAFTEARDNPAGTAAELARLIPIDVAFIQEALERYAEGYDIVLQPDVLDNLSKLMLDNDVIDAPIDWATFLDQSYLPDHARADLEGAS